MNGKGDTQRPIDRRKWEKNFEAIRWKSKTRKGKDASKK
jgi:hypothetical protein